MIITTSEETVTKIKDCGCKKYYAASADINDPAINAFPYKSQLCDFHNQEQLLSFKTILDARIHRKLSKIL